MSVDHSAWIGFGVAVIIDKPTLPDKYDGWGIEEILEDCLCPEEDLPANDSGPVSTVTLCRAGYEAYGGRGSWYVVARDSYCRLDYDCVKLRVSNAPGDLLKWTEQLKIAIEKLLKHDWIKVEGPAEWLGAMWMH